MGIEELENLVGITYKIYLFEEDDDVWAKIIKAVFKITKAAYKRCKELLKEYKVKYGNVIPEDSWDYFSLSLYENDIKRGRANSVEEAIELFKKEVKDFTDSLD